MITLESLSGSFNSQGEIQRPPNGMEKKLLEISINEILNFLGGYYSYKSEKKS